MFPNLPKKILYKNIINFYILGTGKNIINIFTSAKRISFRPYSNSCFIFENIISPLFKFMFF